MVMSVALFTLCSNYFMERDERRRVLRTLRERSLVRDLANDDLKRTRQMLDLSKRRLDSGIDSHYQYQQTESLEASSQSQLIDAEKQLQAAHF